MVSSNLRKPRCWGIAEVSEESLPELLSLFLVFLPFLPFLDFFFLCLVLLVFLLLFAFLFLRDGAFGRGTSFNGKGHRKEQSQPWIQTNMWYHVIYWPNLSNLMMIHILPWFISKHIIIHNEWILRWQHTFKVHPPDSDSLSTSTNFQQFNLAKFLAIIRVRRAGRATIVKSRLIIIVIPITWPYILNSSWGVQTCLLVGGNISARHQHCHLRLLLRVRHPRHYRHSRLRVRHPRHSRPWPPWWMHKSSREAAGTRYTSLPGLRHTNARVAKVANQRVKTFQCSSSKGKGLGQKWLQNTTVTNMQSSTLL